MLRVLQQAKLLTIYTSIQLIYYSDLLSSQVKSIDTARQNVFLQSRYLRYVSLNEASASQSASFFVDK